MMIKVREYDFTAIIITFVLAWFVHFYLDDERLLPSSLFVIFVEGLILAEVVLWHNK